jgi:hypothetical protein
MSDQIKKALAHIALGAEVSGVTRRAAALALEEVEAALSSERARTEAAEERAHRAEGNAHRAADEAAGARAGSAALVAQLRVALGVGTDIDIVTQVKAGLTAEDRIRRALQVYEDLREFNNESYKSAAKTVGQILRGER